jgi:NAD(P)-dependent dehydrogenase (short-subunit alcohol dehydrogenase family)
MAQMFEGKVAVITGAGRGIGRATALYMAARGAAVVVNDSGAAVDGTGRSPQPAQDVAADVTNAGGRAIADTEDVGDWHGAQRLIERALRTFGQIDILVNNAGIGDGRALWDIDEPGFARVVAASVNGTFNCTRHAVRHMMARTRGHIVNFVSRAALVGIANTSAYSAAKGGVYGFTNVAARDLAPFNIRVNAMAPAATRTRMVTEGITVPGRDAARIARD